MIRVQSQQSKKHFKRRRKSFEEILKDKNIHYVFAKQVHLPLIKDALITGKHVFNHSVGIFEAQEIYNISKV